VAARLPIAVLVLALAACAPGRDPDFYVRGTGIVVDTGAAFARQEDFPARIESTVGEALAYWGGDWSRLEGRTITLSGEDTVRCGDGQSLGCFDGDIRLTTEDPGAGTFECVEQTSLVHEVGHAVLGDALHDDPRWMELDPVAERLAGRRAYGRAGDGECVIWVSVWRHPHGRR
jgi:hypothetical protein